MGDNNIWPAWLIKEILETEKEVKPDLLMVYGILKKGYSLDLSKEGCEFLGEAVLKGANLYRIGDGVGLAMEGDGKVYGEVFRVPSPETWKWLDRIEGHPHLYMRQKVQAQLYSAIDRAGSVEYESQEIECWVYVHQLPEFFGERIESGKYENSSEYARG